MLQGQVVEEEAEFAFKRSIDAAMCGVVSSHLQTTC